MFTTAWVWGCVLSFRRREAQRGQWLLLNLLHQREAAGPNCIPGPSGTTKQDVVASCSVSSPETLSHGDLAVPTPLPHSSSLLPPLPRRGVPWKEPPRAFASAVPLPGTLVARCWRGSLTPLQVSVTSSILTSILNCCPPVFSAHVYCLASIDVIHSCLHSQHPLSTGRC